MLKRWRERVRRWLRGNRKLAGLGPALDLLGINSRRRRR